MKNGGLVWELAEIVELRLVGLHGMKTAKQNCPMSTTYYTDVQFCDLVVCTVLYNRAARATAGCAHKFYEKISTGISGSLKMSIRNARDNNWKLMIMMIIIIKLLIQP